MIGGTVLNIVEKEDCKMLVVVGVGVEVSDMIFVNVESEADVEKDDAVWWQSGQVFVTRGSQFEKVFRDKPCRKIGYSYGHCHLPLRQPAYHPPSTTP